MTKQIRLCILYKLVQSSSIIMTCVCESWILWTCGSRKYAFGSSSADPSVETLRVPTPDTCRKAREAHVCQCQHALSTHLLTNTSVSTYKNP